MPSEELSVQLQRVRQTILKSGKKIYVEGLRGSASAYFISQLHQLEKGKTILVITSNQNRAELLMDDLNELVCMVHFLFDKDYHTHDELYKAFVLIQVSS